MLLRRRLLLELRLRLLDLVLRLGAVHLLRQLLRVPRQLLGLARGLLLLLRERLVLGGRLRTRGMGLMLAIEFTGAEGKAVAAECLNRGLVLHTAGDSILRILPPVVITPQEVDEGLGILEAAIKAIVPTAGSP